MVYAGFHTNALAKAFYELNISKNAYFNAEKEQVQTDTSIRLLKEDIFTLDKCISEIDKENK